MPRPAFHLTLLALLLTFSGLSSATEDVSDADGSPAVIFDIDGTLTPSILDFVSVREDSLDAVNLWLDMGYQVAFVTARPSFTRWYTQTVLWLQGFPVEDISAMVFAPFFFDTTEKRVAYKTQAIRELVDSLHLNILYAYGDSGSDFRAFERAGLDPNRTFALRRVSFDHCLEGAWAVCLDNFTEHMAYIAQQPHGL